MPNGTGMTVDVMIDIESLNITTDSIILSLAAVTFLRGGAIEDYKDELLLVLNTEQEGRTFSHSTLIDFHLLTVPNHAQAYLNSPTVMLPDALTQLQEFIQTRTNKDSRIWANGCCFDVGILENAFDQHGVSAPWKFFQVRDLRTIIDVFDAKDLKRQMQEEVGDLHNPLSDCIWQLRLLQNLLCGG